MTYVHQGGLGPRRGIALATALIAIVIVSFFIAGSAFFATADDRASRNALSGRIALEAADYGAAAFLRDWDPAQNITLPIGASVGPITTSLSDGATATSRLLRTSETTFWVISGGEDGLSSNPARRTVGLFYRIALATPTLLGALTVRDSVEVTGGVVTGSDSSAAGVPWCTAAPIPVAGVVAPDTSRVCDGACGSSAGNVSGTPPKLADPTAADSLRYLVFGDRSWPALTRSADVVLPPNAVITPAPAAAGGTCQHSLQTNWGDSASAAPCTNYMPVIWAQGDVTIDGGSGQGILLADGDVRLGAGASFTGVVIARDDITFLAGGGTIHGAAMAGDARSGPGDHTVVDHGAVIRYSSCAVFRALLGSAPLERVRERSWAQFY